MMTVENTSWVYNYMSKKPETGNSRFIAAETTAFLEEKNSSRYICSDKL